MLRWIIEADVRRLTRELSQGASFDRRARIIDTLQKREAQLWRLAHRRRASSFRNRQRSA